MTIPISSAPISGRNPNDIFYQLENISNLFNHDYMFDEGTYINYKFNPVRLDQKSGDLVKLTAGTGNTPYDIPISADNAPIIDANGNITGNYGFTGYPVNPNNIDSNGNFILNINNSDTIRSYYVNEYARDLRDIINSLIYDNSDIYQVAANYNPNDPVGYVNSYENFLLKISNKLSALKGTFYLIELILGLYSKFFSKDLISFKEDTVNKFIYRITTTMDVRKWKSILKPYVHPMGWYDNFNPVETTLTDLIFQPYDINKVVKATFKLKTISYLDAERYFINQSPYIMNVSSTALPFYNFNGIELDYKIPIEPNFYVPPGTGDYFGNLRHMVHLHGNTTGEVKYFNDNKRFYDAYGKAAVPFDDIASFRHKKFNTKPALTIDINNSISSEYDNITSLDFINATNMSFYLNMDLKNNISFLNMIYNNPGFATEYQWSIYYGNKLVKSVITPFNKYSLDLKDLSNLLGKNNNWVFDPTQNTFISTNYNSYNSSTLYNSYDFIKNLRISLTLKYNTYSKKVFEYELSSLITRKDLKLSGEERFWNPSYIGTRLKSTISLSNYMNAPMSNLEDIALENFISPDRNITISYLSYSTSAGTLTDSFDYNPILITKLVSAGNISQSNIDNQFILTFKPLDADIGDTIFGVISNYRWVLKYANTFQGQTPNILYQEESKLNTINLVLPKINDQNNNLTIPVNNYFIDLFITLNNNIEYQVDTSTFKFIDSTIIG